MEQNTVTLVQDSFSKVKPIAATAAEIFYAKLFELDPALKPLFPTDKEGAMKEQGNKLMTMLGAAVAAGRQLRRRRAPGVGHPARQGGPIRTA